jgi:glycosyltransferase involved in cell wall biosynthesis
MKISVIIATYQPKKEYLQECLTSLQRQTYPKELFEVIIVLNGLKHPYFAEINALIKQMEDSHIRLLYSEVTGLANGRNVGMDDAQGEYICFIDDDDFVSESYLANLIGLASSDAIVVSTCKTVKDGVCGYGEDYISRAFIKNRNTKSTNILRLRSFLSSACFKIIPKTVISDSRFNCKFSIGEDSPFMFLISKQIKHIYLSSAETIYYRRLRENSLSRKKLPLQEGTVNAIKSIKEILKIYLKAPREYNFLLMLSRMAALGLSIFRR